MVDEDARSVMMMMVVCVGWRNRGGGQAEAETRSSSHHLIFSSSSVLSVIIIICSTKKEDNNNDKSTQQTKHDYSSCGIINGRWKRAWFPDTRTTGGQGTYIIISKTIEGQIIIVWKTYSHSGVVYKTVSEVGVQFVSGFCLGFFAHSQGDFYYVWYRQSCWARKNFPWNLLFFQAWFSNNNLEKIRPGPSYG